MKTLAPVVLVLILLLAVVSALSAQHKIQNPELPQNLVFQWKIKTDQVDAKWSNEDFSIMRDEEDLLVFYGVYFSLSEALKGLPELPDNIGPYDVELVPFFNQWSISSEDALTLLSDRTAFDVGLKQESDLKSVSFTVYFETFDKPQGRKIFSMVDQPLSFEVLPNYHLAYSAGMFPSYDEAKTYASTLRENGFVQAEVNKFLNGEKIAYADELKLESYLAYVGW